MGYDREARKEGGKQRICEALEYTKDGVRDQVMYGGGVRLDAETRIPHTHTQGHDLQTWDKSK